MNKKQILVFSILSLFIFSFMLSFISAEENTQGTSEFSGKALGQPCKSGMFNYILGDGCAKNLFCNTSVFLSPEEIEGGFNGKCNVNDGIFVNFVEKFFLNNGKHNLLDRILIFALVFAVIYGIFASVEFFGKFSTIVISLVMSLLGVRFIPDNFLMSLIAPTNALTALILFGLPFLVVFLITTKEYNRGTKDNPISIQMNKNIQRIVWGVYLLFCIWMYITNLTKDLSVQIVNWISLIFCFISLFMILFSPIITKYRNALSRDMSERIQNARLKTSMENAQILRTGNFQVAMSTLEKLDNSLKKGDQGRVLYNEMRGYNKKEAEDFYNKFLENLGVSYYKNGHKKQ